MRRTIALTITAALALALAPFGVAQASHTDDHPQQPVINIVKPSGDLSGTVDAEVQITEDILGQGIYEYWVELRDSGGLVGTFCHEAYEDDDGNPAPLNDSRTLKFKWDTNRYQTGDGVTNCDGGNPTLPTSAGDLPNGNYTIYVEAHLWDGAGGITEKTKNHASKAIDVNNAPATPTGVKLKYKESADQITVSWNANPESGYDVIAYRVQECTVDRSSKPCSSWKTVDDVSETSLTVKRTEPGIYRYRVVALRLDAGGNGWITSSGAATPQSDPTEIVVEEDPDPTSTTQPGNNDDDGSDEEASPTTSEPETRTVVKPTRRVQRAAPQVLQRTVEEDPGYQDELPYENDDDEEAISGLPIDGNNEDGDGQLSTLVPLAGGLTLLIFALQLWYLNNRAGRTLEPIPVEAYGPDEGWDE